jgi:hypothetical protein
LSAACTLLCCLNCSAKEDDFYAKVLAEIGTNRESRVLETPSLIEETNRQPNLSESKLDLKTVHVRSEIAGVRLGMSMEQVVATWGKPRTIRFCNNHLQLLYADRNAYGVQTGFDLANNSVTNIYVSFPVVDGKPSPGPMVQECLRVFGKPQRVLGPDPLVIEKDPGQPALLYDL